MDYKYLVVIFLFLFSFKNLNAQKKSNKKKFVIEGSLINNKNLKSIFISYLNDNQDKIIDSAKVINNKFTFCGNITYPTFVTICNNANFSLTETGSTQIFFEPKKMQIILDSENFSSCKVIGSVTENENENLKNLKKELNTRRDSTYRLILNYQEEIKNSNDSIKTVFEKKRNDLNLLLDKNEIEQIKIELEFFKHNLNSFIAPSLLLIKLRRSNGLLFYKTIDSIYKKLNNKVKTSSSGKNLKKSLIFIKNSKVGVKAPLFNLRDIYGKTISINSLKNKYFIMDFWASWCEPCREDFPFLRQQFLKYKKQGFEILSISKDKSLVAWRNAIKKEETQAWINISLSENNSKLDEKYFVSAIPVKILIDKDGFIIGRWRGGREENKKKIIDLLNEIFSKK